MLVLIIFQISSKICITERVTKKKVFFTSVTQKKKEKKEKKKPNSKALKPFIAQKSSVYKTSFGMAIYRSIR